jgi:flavin-dependent thymidylate synthase
MEVGMESRSKEVQPWADQAMFEAPKMEGSEQSTRQTGVLPKVHLLWMTPDPLGAIAAACRMYEGEPTYSLADITDNDRRLYWEQVQKTHLKAPFEFVKLHFFIEGVDRAFTHQIVRQRTAVYAQESLRFAVKDNMKEEASLPPSLQDANHRAERKAWDDALDYVEAAYKYLVANGIPAEDARGLLPHATTTRLNYCTDLRNLAEHAGNRLCTQAQFHWRIVFGQIVQAIREFEPDPNQAAYWNQPSENQWQFGHIADSNLFRPVCYAQGKCPFNSKIDRGCKIRERVDSGRWDEIKDSEWFLDPRAGVTTSTNRRPA